MKKQIKLFALTATLLTLSACGNPKATISITNKFNEMTIVDNDYSLRVDLKNAASGSKLKYTISDSQVASINEQGVIHFKKLGNATVNVALENDDSIKDSFSFNVVSPHVVSISGKLVDWNGTAAENVMVACNGYNALTNTTGDYTIDGAIVGNIFYVSTHNAKYQDTKTYFTYKADTFDYDLDLKLNHYQPLMKAFVENDNPSNYISINAYHTIENNKDGVTFTLNTTFNEAFNKGNTFDLYINSKESRPDGVNTYGDYMISFDRDEINWNKSYKYDTNNNKVALAKDNNCFATIKDGCLEVFMTVGNNQTLDFSIDETFGFYLQANLTSPKKEGKCLMFAHNATKENQYSYARIDKTGKAFAGTGNADKFHNITFDSDSDLNWQFLKDSNNENVLVGEVGHVFDDGYRFKVARYVGEGDDKLKDVYFLFKKTNPDQNPYFFEEVYEPNIFIDTVQTKAEGDHDYPRPGDDSHDTPVDPERVADNRVRAFKMMTGYWLRKYTPTSPSAPFENLKEFTDQDVYQKGIDIYSEGDFMVLKIPYEALGLDKTKPFGFTINLFYRGWKAWVGNNPSGYRRIPHFEAISSYVRINESDEDTFHVIPYDNQ